MNTSILQFDRPADIYGVFSNHSNHSIGLQGTTWKTVEHYMQAQKFADASLWHSIQMAQTADEAITIANIHKQQIRSDWQTVEDATMKRAILAKVLQHHDVRKQLLETGTASIVYHTNTDTYWGDGEDGTGKNMLGKIFMEVREELTKNGPYDELHSFKLPLWIQAPDIERGSIGWRMGAGEDIAWEFFLWWRGLSSESKKKYTDMYPEPAEWAGWYDTQK